MHRFACLSVLLSGSAVAMVSCSSSNQSPAAAADGAATSCADGQLIVDGACVTPSSAWTQIKTGGATTCGLGDPYSFFVHLGTTNKLLVYFAFGGFCYNAQLCAAGALNFVPKVNVDTKSLAQTSGIFDLSRPDNPFKDWSWVYVPECTADFEWGNNVAQYPAMGSSPAVTVHHNGFVNVTAVRNWVYENFKSPDRIFVSGSSGGADAALMHYSYIRQHYTNVKNWAFLADSSFGVVTDQFFTSDIVSWKAYDNRPMWIPAIANAAPSQLTWDFLEIEGAKYFQTGAQAEFGTAYDTLESITYEIMGGMRADWHDKMEAHIQNVSAQTPSFRYLIAPGTAHIVLNQGTFYQYQVNGMLLRDWVSALANGQDVQSSQCTSNCMVTQLPEDAGTGGTGGISEVGINCLGTSECNQGEVCCANIATQATSCASGAACPLGGIQLCSSDTDCAGAACTPTSVMGVSIGTCGGLGGLAGH